jgi:hypothetical protein
MIQVIQENPTDIRPIPNDKGYFAGADGRIYSERQDNRRKSTLPESHRRPVRHRPGLGECC